MTDRKKKTTQGLHPTHLDAVLLARNVQRREAVEGARVHVGPVVEQQLGDLDVAAVGSHVQRGQVVAGGLVDELGRVVEEDAGRLDMVALFYVVNLEEFYR